MTVTREEVDADWQFFDRFPQRHFHIGKRWITRRRGKAFLRTPRPAELSYPDIETAAERAWYDCAFPFLPPLARRRMAEEARRARTKPLASSAIVKVQTRGTTR